MKKASALLSMLVAILLCGCSGLASRPGAYHVRLAQIALAHHTLALTLVTPETPRVPGLLILYATGDDGWFGLSKYILEHMAQHGYTIAAFDSSVVVSAIEASGGRVGLDVALLAVDSLLIQAKQQFGLPESTPVVVTGFSRGASLVVLAAGEPSVRRHIAGGVAMALTRESDYLLAPNPSQLSSSIQTDKLGRLQMYPAIERLGSLPLSVIQSTGDSYVSAEESRQLFGPDTPTRRLYEVDAKDHAFNGGRKTLFSDLDRSLEWISSTIE